MVGQVKMLIGTSRLTQNAAKKMQDDLEQEKEDEMEGELGEDGVPKKPIDIDSVRTLYYLSIFILISALLKVVQFAKSS